MKNFCALPFHHLMIRSDGTCQICCQHQTAPAHAVNINRTDVDTWLSGPYVQEVRGMFLADQRPPGCAACWTQEDIGAASMRTRSAREYEILGVDTAHPRVENLEIDLGNLCNLKCLMCSEKNSSALLAENRKLGINKIEQQDMDWTDLGYKQVQKLIQQRPKVLNIRGGEPLYNRRLLDLVEEIPDEQARTMVLHITTNATVWNQRWHTALRRFRIIRMMFSVDAVGDLYEYMRFPAVWTEVEKNITDICQLPNVRPLVHAVVQNLNISRLDRLIDWCHDRSLYLEFEHLSRDMSTGQSITEHLQIQNLPPAQKTLAVDSLTHLANRSHLPEHLSLFVRGCLQILDRSVADPHAWQRFRDQIQPRDRLRDRSYQRFIEE